MIQTLSPIACRSFTNGAYLRTFVLRVYDRYGRESNAIVRKLKVITAAVVYSSAKPIKVTNKQPPTTLQFNAVQLNPLYMDRFTNLTVVTDVYN